MVNRQQWNVQRRMNYSRKQWFDHFAEAVTVWSEEVRPKLCVLNFLRIFKRKMFVKFLARRYTLLLSAHYGFKKKSLKALHIPHLHQNGHLKETEYFWNRTETKSTVFHVKLRHLQKVKTSFQFEWRVTFLNRKFCFYIHLLKRWIHCNVREFMNSLNSISLSIKWLISSL